MIKLWYFLKGDESGKMNISVFPSWEEYDKFIENFGDSIEIFQTKELY